ncbi:hypothetical protein ACFYQQ_21205 [Streptomyces sp. NPDC005496]|uniref:hypothetical protein n=1 Tax=unclassified Streptomyces TaxID=2593676 RepID=UPI0033A62B66
MKVEVFAHPLSFRADASVQAETLARNGVDGVRLAYAYHGGRWLLSTSEPGRVEDFTAGLWFTPAGVRRSTGSTPALPVLGDQATTATSALTRAGIQVTAWLVGLHQSPLARARPDLALRNVFGHRYQHALCPAQPEVIRHAQYLVADAASQPGVSGLELEAFGYLGWAHQSAHDKFGVALRPVDRWLMSLCLCQACSNHFTAAGIDTAELTARVRGALRDQFTHARPPSDRLQEDAVAALGGETLSVLLRVRARVTQDLVRAAAAAAPQLPVSIRTTMNPYACDGKAAGDFNGLAAAAGGVTVTNLAGNLKDLRADVSAALRTEATVTAGWSLSALHTLNESELLEVATATQSCAALALYAYDLAPPDRLSWLRLLPRSGRHGDGVTHSPGTEAAR